MTDRNRFSDHLDRSTQGWLHSRDVYITHMLSLYDDFIARNLADDGFVTKMISNESQLWQGVWEMQLARILESSGYTPSKRPVGPDFQIHVNDNEVSFEAISVDRGGIPVWEEEVARGGVFGTPTEQILQRWTGGIKSKKDKYDDYLRDRVSGDTTPFVIAINGSMLGGWGFHSSNRMPYAVNAVFPIGDLAINIDLEDFSRSTTSHTHRPLIHNHNNAPIATDSFLNPAYSYVSAILASDLSPHDSFLQRCPGPTVALIHNPLARNSLPIGFMGVDEEYYVPNGNDHWSEWDLIDAKKER